jgi:hypothetical protein
MSSAALTRAMLTRRGLHVAGSGLALAGVLFVGFRLHAYWLLIDVSRTTRTQWSAIAVLSALYCAANCLLALAWWHLLNHFEVAQSRLDAIRIYGIANLAKYIPGNIFHLAGRQALGMSAGIPASILTKSIVWEFGLIAVSGTVFIANILPRLFPGFAQQAGISLSLLSAVLIASCLGKFFGRQPMAAFLMQTLFLFFSGVVFFVVILLLDTSGRLAANVFVPIVTGYIAAWLVGFVTPGAPAGVGVREIILMFLLKDIIPGENLLLAVLFGRLITVAGDLLFFLFCSYIPAKSFINSK